MTQGIVRYFVMVLGNTMDSHKTFLDHLTISTNLREVSLLRDSDVIIAFVPIVSRAGTDISAAMEKIPGGKPVVLVVLHHTFDQYYIAPDSRLCVKREGVFAVDCLYYEDLGLLRCPCNDEAIRAVREHLRLQNHFTDDFRNVVNGNSYGWIFLVVGVIVGIAGGTGVGITVSHYPDVAGLGAVVGILVGAGVVIPKIIIWVKYGDRLNNYRWTLLVVGDVLGIIVMVIAVNTAASICTGVFVGLGVGGVVVIIMFVIWDKHYS
ncbi:uncharacterized protein Hap1MRO34_003924 [Clarias gariepinus]